MIGVVSQRSPLKALITRSVGIADPALAGPTSPRWNADSAVNADVADIGARAKD